MKNIILWGATGQAIVLEEFLNMIGYNIIALFDNNQKLESPFQNIPLYYGTEGFEKWVQQNEKKETYFIVAIGGDKGKVRSEISESLMKKGLTPATVIHPSAVIAKNVSIGKGSQILINAAVGSRVDIGKFCIINTTASIDHECIIGNGVHIGPGAKLAGKINIGDNSFIGTGAVILPDLKIGSNTVVGAGSVVTKNIPDNVIVYGNPAKIKNIRKQ